MIDYDFLVALILDNIDIFDKGQYYDKFSAEFDSRLSDDHLCSFYIESENANSDKEFSFKDNGDGMTEITENLNLIAFIPENTGDVLKIHDTIVYLLHDSGKVQINTSSIKSENIISNELEHKMKNTSINAIKINFTYKICTSIPKVCCN